MTAGETQATDDADSKGSDLRSRTVEWHDPNRVSATGTGPSGIAYS